MHFSEIPKSSMFVVILEFWMKICIPCQNLSGKNALKVNFQYNSTKCSKSNEFPQKNSIMIHDFFGPIRCLISSLYPIHTLFFLGMNNMPISAKILVPYRKTKSQLIHHFNMVHPRDILLTESWGSSRFLST